MTGYTRQSAADIVPGADILASNHNNEFNQVQAAFNNSTGHNHSGAIGEGAPLVADSFTANPSEGATLVTKIGALLVVANITALRALTASQRKNALLRGHATDNDGGGGMFYFDTASTALDDNGITIKPSSIVHPAPGRWIRYSKKKVDCRWFGAKGDNTTDDTAAIQAALDTGRPQEWSVGTYEIRDNLVENFPGRLISGVAAGDREPGPSNIGTQKTHTVIKVVGDHSAIVSGNGVAFCPMMEKLHIFSIDRSNLYTSVGIDFSTGTFNGALTGRNARIKDCAIWYFQTGVALGSADDSVNYDPQAWAFHLTRVKCWTCQVGFRINGTDSIGWAAQSHMTDCTALQTDGQWGAGSGNVKGYWQSGGDVLHSNARYEGNDWNVYVENGYSHFDKPALEGANVGVWNITSKSRVIVNGGYSSSANNPAPGWAWCVTRPFTNALIPPVSLPLAEIGSGNIHFTNHCFIDSRFFGGGAISGVLFKMVDHPANVYCEGLTLRNRTSDGATPDYDNNIYEDGADRYVPHIVSFAGGPASGGTFAPPYKFIPVFADRNAAVASIRMTRMALNDNAVPGVYQDRGFLLDQDGILTAVGDNIYASIPAEDSSNGVIIINGTGRWNGVDNEDMNIHQIYTYSVDGGGTTSLTKTVDTSGTTATTNVVHSITNTGSLLEFKAKLAATTPLNGYYQLSIKHISRINGLIG